MKDSVGVNRDVDRDHFAPGPATNMNSRHRPRAPMNFVWKLRRIA